MKAYFTILLLFLILFETRCSNVAASEVYKSISYPEEKSRLKVTLLVDASLQDEVPMLEKLTSEALHGVESLLGLQFRDSIWIYFNSHPEAHNGLATVIPSNRIYINVTPPEEGSSLSFSEDYLADTLWHELTHMIVMQQRGGIFEGLSNVFGTLSRPIGAWPRWLHEGMAVWVESKKGGRGHSGIIDLQLRELAEFEMLNKTSAFESFHLDGSAALFKIHEGDMPYHFGYLLIDKIFSSNPKLMGRYVKEQSYSLGTSFRIELRAMGIHLETLYEQMRNDWKKLYSKVDPPVSADKRIAEAESFISLRNIDDQVTWIEWGDDNQAVIELRSSEHKSETWKWPHFNFIPEKIFKYKGKWLAHVWTPDEFKADEKKHFLVEFDSKHNEVCRTELPLRTRELEFNGQSVAWIREDYAMRVYIERADYLASCRLGETQKVYQSPKSFVRLSSLSFLKNGQLSFAFSDGRNTQRTKIKLGDQHLESAYPLSHLRELPKSWCSPGALDCYTLQIASRDYWGPLILSCSKKSCQTRKLKLNTGAAEATPWGDSMLAKIFHWKSDELIKFSTSDFKEAGPDVHLKQNSREVADSKSTLSSDIKDYSPLKTIFPEFWIPLVAVDQKGSYFGANVFYEDVSETWSGDTSLAYSSEVKSLVGRSQLEKNFRGAWNLSSISAHAEFWPRIISDEVQKRQNYGVLSNFSLWKAYSQRLFMSVGVSNTQAAESRFLRSYNYWSPKLNVTWLLGPRQDPRNPDLRFSSMSPALSLDLATSYYESWATKEVFRLQENISGKLALQVELMHAYTDRRNYPASFWQWGGREVLSNNSEDFLNRGFAPRFVAAQELMRFSVEGGYRLMDRIFSSSWNRLRFEEWEQRWVIETISWDSFRKTSRFKMGRQFFTSVGVENDFFAQVFHYSNIKSTLGLFKGFGTGGEWRIAWTLQSYLDLF